jgi:hypothetical protein
MPAAARKLVFISYSHDSLEHKRRVRALADQLRADGVEAWVDQYVQDPEEGWISWTRNQVKQADQVLLVFTEVYQRRYEGNEEAGEGLGATFEGVIVTQWLYESGGRNAKFRPVVFREEDVQFIPVELRRFSRYRVDIRQGYEMLLRWLHGRPAILAPEVGTMPTLEPEPDTKLFPAKEPGHGIHNLPFPPNPLFRGREADLEKLGECLRHGGKVAPTQTVALHGLGGVGKTQLAVEYAWRCLDSYEAVLWVRAESPDVLETNLAALVQVLDLPEAGKPEQDVQTGAVLNWLKRRQRWLLIADNADTEEAASAVRDRLSPNLGGHVLVTSRLGHWPPNMPHLPVELLPPQDAARYFLDRVAKAGHLAGDETSARALAKELGYLPLALEQAAAFLIELRWTFDQCRAQFRSARPDLLDVCREGATRYPASVAKTWSMTLERLSPLARILLRLVAWLAPDAIPRGIFCADHRILSEALGSYRQPSRRLRDPVPGHGRASTVTISDLEVGKALSELDRLSLIRLTSETVWVHRLLQAVEQDALKKEDCACWIEWVAWLLNAFALKRRSQEVNAFEEAMEPWQLKRWPELRGWENWTPLGPHVEAPLGPHVEAVVEHAVRQDILGSDFPSIARSAELLSVYRTMQYERRRQMEVFQVLQRAQQNIFDMMKETVRSREESIKRSAAQWDKFVSETKPERDHERRNDKGEPLS